MSGVTDPASPYFKDGQWGWDGTVWRKLPLVWGYYDRYAERVVDDTADAGTNWVSSTVVPAGSVYVVQALAAVDLTSAMTSALLSAIDGTYGYNLAVAGALAAGVPILWSGEVVLKQGDQITATYRGCTLNDDLELMVWGYKMKIAE